MDGGRFFIISCLLLIATTTIHALLAPRTIIQTSQLRLSAAPVIIDASNNLALGMGAISVAAGFTAVQEGKGFKVLPSLVAAVTLFLAHYLQSKTESSRFKFDDEAFSIVRVDGSSIGNNPVMGSTYEWPYKTIVEYRIFPNERLPILLYFKENKTPADKYVVAPVSVSARPGQVHVFPIIGNAEQLRRNLHLPVHQLSEVEKPEWVIETNPILFVKGLALL